MILSAKTMDILKNYSSINSCITVKAGSELTTISPNRDITSRAKVVEVFPVDFSIYSLSQCLQAITLLGTPELEFSDRYVNIYNKQTSLIYNYCDPELIKRAFKIPNFSKLKVSDSNSVQFKLLYKDIQDTLKAISIMNLTDMSFVGDGETIKLQAEKKVDSNTGVKSGFYSTIIGQTDKKFCAYFNPATIKMISADYDVKISLDNSLQVIYMNNPEIEYWIIMKETSMLNLT
jgi:hypothetical protein